MALLTGNLCIRNAAFARTEIARPQWFSPLSHRAPMDTKAKKKIDVIRQRIAKLRVLLAAAKKQMDDPEEVKSLEAQIHAGEAEITKLQAS